MSTNISLGTYLPDSVRIGPSYLNSFPNGLVPDGNGVITSGGNLAYGPGILLSPIQTWTFTPAAPGVGFTTHNNVVALTGVGTITQAQDLQLLHDNSVTFYSGGLIQLDWPRIPTVTISGAAATVGTRVTIFGYDWYGYPLQHTYVVSATGTYPDITLGGGVSGSLSVNAKAFYQITRANIDTPLPGGCQLSIGVADVFGLPYLTTPVEIQNVLGIGWGEGSELFSFAAAAPLTAAGVYVGGDTTFPATATTRDVRGVYGPSTASDGVQKLVFTYYVEGADAWQNQVANKQQNFLIQNPSAAGPQGVPVPPLVLSDLVGVPQFYTGNPS